MIERNRALLRCLSLLCLFTFLILKAWAQPPVIQSIGPNPVCPGEIVTIVGDYLDGNGPDCNPPSHWEIKIGGESLPLGNLICWRNQAIQFTVPNVDPHTGGAYFLDVKVGPGSNNEVRDTIYIVQKPSISYGIHSICPGKSIQVLTPELNVFYTCSGGASIDSQTGEVGVPIGFTSPNVNVTVRDDYGCGLDSTITVPVSSPTPPNFFYEDRYLCKPSSYTTSPVPSGGTFSIQNLSSLGALSITSSGTINAQNSALGDYSVTYSAHNVNGCYSSSSFLVTIGEDLQDFAYDQSSVCQSDVSIAHNWVSPSPVFSALPSPGLTLTMDGNGIIYPSQSSVGTYSIICTDPLRRCRRVDTTTITITQAADANFNYSQTDYCSSDLNTPQPYPPNGTFSSIPPGLMMNTSSGEIYTHHSNFDDFGTYIIERFVSNSFGCTDVDTEFVRILADTAALIFTDTVACSDHNLLVHNGMEAGGFFFSNPPGHPALDTVFGFIDPSLASVPTSFQVCWFLGGRTCRDVICSDQTIEIIPTPDPEFHYPQSFYCSTSLPIAPSDSTGSFRFIGSTTTALDTHSGIWGDTSTLAGTYLIERRFFGECPSRDTFEVAICRPDTIIFHYLNPDTSLGNTYCQNIDYAYATPLHPTPTGGTYSYIPPSSGYFLDLNPVSGLIDLAASTPGTYTVQYYSAQGTCPATGSAEIVIFSSPDASFDLDSYFECQGVPTIDLTSVIDPSGLWQITPPMLTPAGIDPIDPVQLQANIIWAQEGIYTVKHTVGSGNCQADASRNFTIIKYDSTTQLLWTQPPTTCEGDTLYFNIDGNPDGQFVAPGLSFDRMDSATYRIPLPETLTDATFNIRYSFYGQCGETLTDSFYVHQNDPTRFIYMDSIQGYDAFCENAITATPLYAWPQQGTFAIQTDSNVTIDPLTGELTLDQLRLASEIRVLVTYTSDSICINEASREIAIYPAPKRLRLTTSPPFETCYRDSIELSAYADGAAFFAFYSGDSTFNFAGENEGTLENWPPGTFNFNVVFTSSRNCVADTFIPFTVHPTPLLEPLPDSLVTLDGARLDDLNLSGSPSNIAFKWYMYDTSNVSVIPYGGMSINSLPNLLSPNALPFRFALRDQYSKGHAHLMFEPVANGCEGAKDSVRIVLLPEGIDLFIPGVFTPNGDGLNDTWEIQDPDDANSFTGYRMLVYNLSGALVHDMRLPNAYWDGAGVPDGIYRWVLLDTAGRPSHKGGLTIRRR